MLRSALLTVVSAAAVAQDLDFFAKHVNPLTEIVNRKFGNATTQFSVSEACNLCLPYTSIALRLAPMQLGLCVRALLVLPPVFVRVVTGSIFRTLPGAALPHLWCAPPLSLSHGC